MSEIRGSIEEISLSEIAVILRQFGLYRHYKGCSRLIYAVLLVMENERRLEAVVKEVYMPVAKKFDCSWGAVESSLKVAGTHAWISNYEELCEIAGVRLRFPPTPAELLDIFAMHIKFRISASYYVSNN